MGLLGMIRRLGKPKILRLDNCPPPFKLNDDGLSIKEIDEGVKFMERINRVNKLHER